MDVQMWQSENAASTLYMP